MSVLSKETGWLVLFLYLVVMCLLAWAYSFRDGKMTKLSFLVANRTIKGGYAALSIAATWIWAPALFVASEKAYTQGIVGAFWFIAPNIGVLVLFGFFANWMRKKKPEGWTFTDSIRETYSNRTHNLFLVESFGLQTMSFAVQLLAGAAIMHTLTGIAFFPLTVAMAVIPIIYTLAKGLKTSVMTDYWQMLVIAIVLAIGLPYLFMHTAPGSIIKGLSGASGKFGNLFDSNGLTVFLTFGLSTTIGLLSGPFGDQMLWQRIFAVKKEKVKSTMMWSAVWFGIVPISLAIFGFAVAGSGVPNGNTQLTNLTAILNWTPHWFIYFFVVMILSGLISTLDSIITAVSSIVGHDIQVRTQFKFDVVDASRIAMVAVAIVGIAIANIPGLKIVYLFLFYGTLRASVLLPTMWHILDKKMSEKGLFYGVLASICIGLPIFAYGNLNKVTWMIVGGSLISLLASGIISRTGKNKINSNSLKS